MAEQLLPLGYQRSVLALKLEGIYSQRAKEKQLAGLKQYKNTVLENSTERSPINTRVEVAKQAHVSDNTIAKVKEIEAKATPQDLKALIKAEHHHAELERLRAGYDGCGCADCQERKSPHAW